MNQEGSVMRIIFRILVVLVIVATVVYAIVAANAVSAERLRVVHIGHEELHANLVEKLAEAKPGDFVVCENDRQLLVVVTERGRIRVRYAALTNDINTWVLIDNFVYKHCKLVGLDDPRYLGLARQVLASQ